MPDLDWDQVSESLRLDEALDALGVVPSYRRNGEVWCSCPLPSHPGADRSGTNFSVNENTFLWNCFTCGDGGLLPTLVQRLEGVDTWAEALLFLVEYSDADPNDDIAFVKQIAGYAERPHKRPIKSRDGKTLPFFSEGVLEPYMGLGEVFWAERGITPETMAEFKLGYDPEAKRFNPKREGEEYIGPTLLIPHYFGGRLVGYQRRWLEYGQEHFPKWLPKYTNSKDFPRKETIFNYDRAYASPDPVIVVESVMTVFRLWQLGYPAVATFGGSTPDEMLRLLRTFRQGLILSFDNDPDWVNQQGKLVKGTGYVATQRLIRELSGDVPVDVVPPPKGRKADLGDLPDDEIVAQLGKAEPGFLLLANT